MMSKERYTLADLEMPDDEPMVIIRSSHLWICDGDKYAAAALNMYVHWTRWIMKHKPLAQEMNRILKRQGKPASQDTGLIIYRKQSLLVTDLLNFCNEKRLRQANDLLTSKGLLKIDGTPRSISDHILKYELQIGTFKTCMAAWKKHRQENQLEDSDEVVETALEANSNETDNSPLRDGQFTASRRTIVGSGTDNSPLLIRSIDNKNIDDTLIDRESVSATSQTTVDCDGSIEHITPLTLSEKEIDLILSLRNSATKGGVIIPPSSDNITPPMVIDIQPTPVGVSQNAHPFNTTPLRSGDYEQSSMQDKSSTSHATTTTAKNSEETHASTTALSLSSNGVGLSGLASQSQNELFPNAEISAESVVVVEKPAIPVMPPTKMKWCAEKLVQFTESRRFVAGKQGAYFSDVVRGKSDKSQRERQFAAAKRILERKITEAEYIAAYDDQNDDFWNNRGSLTVEIMAANTPRSVMRVIEVTEKIASRSTTVGSKPATNVVTPPPAPALLPATMTREEAETYKDKLLEMTRDKYPQVQAKVVSESPDAWYVRVKWAEKKISNIKSVNAFAPSVARKLSDLDTLAKEAI